MIKISLSPVQMGWNANITKAINYNAFSRSTVKDSIYETLVY